MQKLNSLNDWKTVKPEEGVEFDGKKRRLVRLKVNAPLWTQFHIRQAGSKETMFLAAVSGLDVIQFSADGSFEIVADNSYNLYSPELDDVEVVHRETESFAKIQPMPQRNRDEEIIHFKAMQNAERRFDALMADKIKMMERASADVREKAAEAVDKPAGDTGDAKPTGEPQQKAAEAGDAAGTDSKGASTEGDQAGESQTSA